MSLQDTLDRTIDLLGTTRERARFVLYSLVGPTPEEADSAIAAEPEPCAMTSALRAEALAHDVMCLVNHIEMVVNDRRQQQEQAMKDEAAPRGMDRPSGMLVDSTRSAVR